MAFQSYVSIKGKKQGQLKGETQKTGKGPNWSEILSVKMMGESAVDEALGRPTGKRTHFPLTITKQMGLASPQLLNARLNSEILDEVVIEIVGRPDTGKGEAVAQRITLTNAQISHVNRYAPALQKGSGHPNNRLIEEYGFTFQKILWEKR